MTGINFDVSFSLQSDCLRVSHQLCFSVEMKMKLLFACFSINYLQSFIKNSRLSDLLPSSWVPVSQYFHSRAAGKCRDLDLNSSSVLFSINVHLFPWIPPSFLPMLATCPRMALPRRPLPAPATSQLLSVNGSIYIFFRRPEFP